jgi:hypothetical protein
MLIMHLNSLPYTKFVLIEDSVTAKGSAILDFLSKNHEKRPDSCTHYFIFERDFNRTKAQHGNSVCHDFTSDSRNWLSNSTVDLQKTASDLSDTCVVIVDSLVHVLYRYGLAETYKIFMEIKNKTNVHQIVTVVHTDLLEDKDKVLQYFQHLATLYMKLDIKRVSYTFKKSAKKIIKEIEEYHFESGRFITEPIKKPDKEVIDNAIAHSIPENMSTFKISLSEKDKESRNNLVLPYLPKLVNILVSIQIFCIQKNSSRENDNSGGKIHYAFDDIDDWDEEDPDDDLDI